MFGALIHFLNLIWVAMWCYVLCRASQISRYLFGMGGCFPVPLMAGFLSLRVTDVWGWIILCRGAVLCAVEY